MASQYRIERDRGTKEAPQQLTMLREKWPLARLGADRFGRRAVKGDALLMPKDGLAVGRRHFPMAKHAERVGTRPAHRGGNFFGGADRHA